MRFLPSTLLLAAAALAADKGRPSLKNAVYKNPKASVEDRVADLLSRMTIEEKASQLLQGDIRNWMNETTNALNQTGLEWSTRYRGSAFYVGVPVPNEWLTKHIKAAQDYIQKETYLGIPAFVQTEGLHGFLAHNATIFSSPIGLGCSWNPSLVEEMAAAIAKEARALGVNQLFAPVADLARELRHGRVEEMYSEDGLLAGEFARAYVKGAQSAGVSAMVKHFAAFGVTEQGLNTGPVHGGERELRTIYLPPYQRAIIDGGVYSIMTAYHSYDGIPAVSDSHLLTDILRDEWGYGYFTMTDAGASDRLCADFKMCASDPIDKEAIVKYILPAGGDVEMGGGSYSFEKIPELVSSGKIKEELVDTAVARVLRAKFELGLFENPFPGLPSGEANKVIHAPEHVVLAKKLDEESIVLLENHNNVLPLSKDASVAVIGPMAHGFMNYGDYVVVNSSTRGITPLDGIKAASRGKVTYAKGCERWSNSQDGFPEAVAAAEAADVAVVVVGTWSRDQNELWQGLNATTGEHVDVDSLDLVGAQEALVRAIVETGKPTVVVFSSGKPVTAPWISEHAAALVQQFYPSEQGGAALASILFGDVNPSGRLSVSFPRSVGDLPVYYDYLNSGRGASPDAGVAYENGTLVFGHQYVLGDPRPLYEFGYGLSYSKFEYGDVTVDKTIVAAQDTVTVTVTVKNVSSREGQEVVQVYVKDLIASVVVPNIRLRGFQKLKLRAGESKRVSIKVKVQDLGVWDARMRYVVEPGDFLFLVGKTPLRYTDWIRQIITFYDIILDPTAYPISPNPWKTRYALNFAKVPYLTTWVPLAAVAETRNALQLPANRKHADGSDFPTLPIIRDPLAATASGSEVVVGDSFDIALHLQNTYLSNNPPSSSSNDPSSAAAGQQQQQGQLFPADGSGTVALHRAFNAFVDQIFSQYGAPLAGFYMPLDPRTAESDKAAFVRRIPGVTRWEDLEIPKGSEVRSKMLAEFESALDTKLGPCFPSPAPADGAKGGPQGTGPFMDGRQLPIYADFIVGGWLQFMRGCLPEWEDMRNKWSGGKWGRLLDALEPWADVDGREGVLPARR
ncbi:beta-glucosidase/beta-xylosidase [Thermothelomyces heterothallicus CBS 202.75]|uniref:beta-glucosidase/beta-xylosidase n=1 Tax=Thermothelomyces heterothallicus CBS 202.75 TaxID=1149848 RepID=UPI003744AC09